MDKAKEIKEIDIKRVYNSLVVVVVFVLIFSIILIISILRDINILFWVSLSLIIVSLVPLVGGLDLIYNHRKNEKEEE